MSMVEVTTGMLVELVSVVLLRVEWLRGIGMVKGGGGPICG